jgi:predicted transcriptional regulator
MRMAEKKARYVGFKIPQDLERELQQIADRDHEGLSVTIRRLLRQAIASGSQQAAEIR